MALTKIKTDGIADEAVTLAKHAPTGSDGQVLTSTGAGTDPAFENILTNGSDNRVVTASSSTTLNGESTLTYSDPELKIDTTSARGKVKLDGTSGGEIIFTKDGTEKLHIYNSEQEARIESADGAANLMVKSGDGNNYAQLQLYPTGTGVAYINSHKDIVVWDGTNSVAHTTFKLGGDIQTTGGISFNPHVDDSASSPYSNVLDDYEEGSWTPAWKASGTDFGDGEITYNSNTSGRYVKIGKQVTVWMYIQIATINTSNISGAAEIINLPFIAQNGPTAIDGATMNVNYYTGMNSIGTGKVPSGYVELNTTEIRCVLVGGNAQSPWYASYLGVGGLYACATYIAA